MPGVDHCYAFMGKMPNTGRYACQLCGRDKPIYPTITHVAVAYDNRVWALPAPNRHHNVLQVMFRQSVHCCGQDVQGFLDSNGTFLARRPAMELAEANGQLIRNSDPKFYQGKELFSEDLW